MQSSAPESAWSAVACSADGNILFAGGGANAASNLLFCVSTNSGITWTSNNVSFYFGPDPSWVGSSCSMVCSADGSKMAALASANNRSLLCTSSNFDANLNTNIFPDINAVSCSADGNHLVLVGSVSIVSTNAGASWVATNSIGRGFYSIRSIAGSADGIRLIGAQANANGGTNSIYISTNGGFSWTNTTAPQTIWSSVASSADGTKLAAAISGWYSDSGPLGTVFGFVEGPIYSSTDSGATWQSNNVSAKAWKSVASSADGTKLVAVVNGGGIWTAQTTPAPSVNLTPTNGNLALSWIVPSTNFVLQQSADLSGWTDLTNQPVLNLTNLREEISLPLSGGNTFFRLKTP